jgi:Flp pilus assembly protein CpaB
MILVIVCALGLGSYCLWQSNVDSKKPEQPVVVESNKGTLVYAIRDIKKGSVLTCDSVETRVVEQCKMPSACVTDASTVIGRKTRYDIEKGGILSKYEFMLPEEAKQYRLDLIGPPFPPDSESKTPTK